MHVPPLHFLEQQALSPEQGDPKPAHSPVGDGGGVVGAPIVGGSVVVGSVVLGGSVMGGDGVGLGGEEETSEGLYKATLTCIREILAIRELIHATIICIIHKVMDRIETISCTSKCRACFGGSIAD